LKEPRKQNNTKVAVVILNWNGNDYLEKFIPILIKYSKHELVELYVADNASTDNSISFLKANFPKIKLILLDRNYGFAGGYNKALAKIEAEYYILLNSDVEVSENWIFPIIDKMDANNLIAAAMPKIKSYHNKEYFEYAGAAGGFIDKYGYPFCRGRGACLFIRSEIFHKQKGFDDDFFAHMEEIDLCWRIKNTGGKIMYYPSTEVFHVGGGALPKNSPKKLFLNYRNNLLMLFKNLSQDKLIKIFFFRMVLDGLSALVYLVKFQFLNFLAVFKAHMSFYKLFFKFKEKRETVIPEKNIIHNEIYKGSIIYKYFIKKNRLFTDFRLRLF